MNEMFSDHCSRVHAQWVWGSRKLVTFHLIPNLSAVCVTRGLFSFLLILFTEIRSISSFRDRIKQSTEPQ